MNCFIPSISPMHEVIQYVFGIALVLGFIFTVVFFINKSFEDAPTFFWYRKIWFGILLLMFAWLVILNDYSDQTLALLFLLAILLVTVIPASYQYHTKHKQYMGMVDSVLFLSAMTLCLYVISFISNRDNQLEAKAMLAKGELTRQEIIKADAAMMGIVQDQSNLAKTKE